MKRLALVGIVVAACSGSAPPARTPEQRTADSAPAVTALQTSKFEDAVKLSENALALDPRNSQAAAVHAIATYQQAGHKYLYELGEIIDKAEKLDFFDHVKGRETWQKILDALAIVDRDLAVVAADPSFSLELCIACWEHDWNRNGKVDERDRKLFEIEFDGKGGELEESDPRRRPTFKLDVGDAEWARAMISFQRAFGELVLAYRWSELDKLFNFFGKDRDRSITIHLLDANRVKRARELVLAGLDAADRCRTAYLAETDDDREWVPNPKQKNHPMPLEVDAALYDTWSGVIGDVRRMLKSEEGVSMREVATVIEPRHANDVPDAYVDLGKMFAEPKDFTINFDDLKGKDDIDHLLRGLLGNGYQASMKRSPLVGRLANMKRQLDTGEDTFDRKLHYLFWLN